jgi:diacylglycerol kinase family enzyme
VIRAVAEEARAEPAPTSQRRSRIAVVVNPHSHTGAWPRGRESLRRDAIVCGELETCADGDNVRRMTRLLGDTRPEIVIAAGGDGTVSDVVQAIMLTKADERPALAILPFGTANNLARSLGMISCRHGGAQAVDLAVATALNGAQRQIDLGRVGLGRVGQRHFVGSFALGMDADILMMRNRLRSRLRLGGYPLYFCSCALNLLRPHGAAARLCVDGSAVTSRAYNLLITNTPIYAGEFRFGTDDSSDDGYLDLHLFEGPLDYLHRFPAAWRRHVRHTRGLPSRAPRERQLVRTLQVELASPVACQLDGEEYESAAFYEIGVVPRALTVRVPA